MAQLTVADLIRILSQYPADAPINILVDEDYEVAFDTDAFTHEIQDDGSLTLDICVDLDVDDFAEVFGIDPDTLLLLSDEDEVPETTGEVVNLADYRKPKSP
jgi:hypothetical protein